MADYFTHFSYLLAVRTPDNAARALDIYNDLCVQGAIEDPPSEGFLLSIDPAHGSSKLWLREDGTGDPQSVIDFAFRCADTFALTGRWGFQWANTCSRPRINAFGGGAHVLDLGQRDTVAWIGTHGWLDDTIRGGRP